MNYLTNLKESTKKVTINSSYQNSRSYLRHFQQKKQTQSFAHGKVLTIHTYLKYWNDMAIIQSQHCSSLKTLRLHERIQELCRITPATLLLTLMMGSNVYSNGTYIYWLATRCMLKTVCQATFDEECDDVEKIPGKGKRLELIFSYFRNLCYICRCR